MSTPTANRIRYPHSQDRKQEAYIVDVHDVDRMLMKQKEYVLNLYKDMTNPAYQVQVRHQFRTMAFDFLYCIRPLWQIFEYEYKYYELHAMFYGYTIAESFGPSSLL
jgi:hypothetical protein